MSIEDVEKLMDETDEAVAYQNVCSFVQCVAIMRWRNVAFGRQEISELLAGQLTAEDDHDVLLELERIEEAEAKVLFQKPVHFVPLLIDCDCIA